MNEPSAGHRAPPPARLARALAGIAAGPTPRRAPARAPFAALFPDGAWPAGSAHEVLSAGMVHRAAATGFALALAAPRAGRIVWCLERRAAGEAGAPHAPGLAAHGIAPERLLVLTLARPVEVLIAAEEAVAAAGVGAVLVELDGDPPALDMTAARRLKLRAARHGGELLLLRHGARAGLPLDCRWRVAAGPSVGPGPRFLGPPAWAVTLEKNRFGRLGGLDLVWDAGEGHVHDRDDASTHERPDGAVPRPRARPAAPAGAGRALARAG